MAVLRNALLGLAVLVLLAGCGEAGGGVIQPTNKATASPPGVEKGQMQSPPAKP